MMVALALALGASLGFILARASAPSSAAHGALIAALRKARGRLIVFAKTGDPFESLLAEIDRALGLAQSAPDDDRPPR